MKFRTSNLKMGFEKWPFLSSAISSLFYVGVAAWVTMERPSANHHFIGRAEEPRTQRHTGEQRGGGGQHLGGASHDHHVPTLRHGIPPHPPSVLSTLKSGSLQICSVAPSDEFFPPLSMISTLPALDGTACRMANARAMPSSLSQSSSWRASSWANKCNWVGVENPVHSLKYLFLTHTRTRSFNNPPPFLPSFFSQLFLHTSVERWGQESVGCASDLKAHTCHKYLHTN